MAEIIEIQDPEDFDSKFDELKDGNLICVFTGKEDPVSH